MIKPAIFTDREKAVMRFMTEGFTEKEMAGKLDICKHAVYLRKQRVFAKLGAESIGRACYLIGHHRLV